MEIKKAVITAAGKGTRFLPVSKAYQKEMIPILTKPQLQYVVEEAIECGIEQIAVLMREETQTFAEYLEDDDKWWKFLKDNNKEELMDSWVEMKKNAEITILKQTPDHPYGNGTPFIIAKDFIGDDYIYGMWGDDIMIKIDDSVPTTLTQLSTYYEKYSPVAVMLSREVPSDQISKYGSYAYFDEKETGIPYHASLLVEKPEPGKAPSNNANSCRFIFGPEVIEELSKKVKGKGGEIWFTDAVSRMIEQGKTVIAPPVEGYETIAVGDPIGWLKANIFIGLRDEKYGEEIKKMLQEFK